MKQLTPPKCSVLAERDSSQKSRCDCSQIGGQSVLIQYSDRWLSASVKFPILEAEFSGTEVKYNPK